MKKVQFLKCDNACEEKPSEPVRRQFNVERAYLKHDDGTHTEVFLILENGLPMVDVNAPFVSDFLNHSHANSTAMYSLVHFLNYAEINCGGYEQISYQEIERYIRSLQIEKKLKYQTLVRKVYAIGDFYSRIIFNKSAVVHQSLLVDDRFDLRKCHKLAWRYCSVFYILEMIIPDIKETDKYHSPGYTKWYSSEQLKALQAELSLRDACIFRIGWETGFRIDGDLSTTLTTYNSRKRELEPTRSKTGQTHVSRLSNELCAMIDEYVMTGRAKTQEKTGSHSEALFLGRNGEELTYHAYYMALKRAGKRVNEKYPHLNLGNVHTHAGRSTFAAAIKSFQLERQRLGLPAPTDSDICALVDWKNISTLYNYDKVTRAQEMPSFVDEVHERVGELLDTAAFIPVSSVLEKGR